METYELNEQKVYEIWLQTIGRGDTTVTTAQLDTLESIAAQCVEEGGRGVLEAIHLHMALTNSNLEVVKCGTEERGILRNAPQTVSDFMLFPNPTNSSFVVNYSMDKGQSGTITILNHLGQQVNRYLLSADKDSIQIPSLPTGMYFVQLAIDGKNIGTKKLLSF